MRITLPMLVLLAACNSVEPSGPRTQIVDASQLGHGNCDGITIAEAIETVHEMAPGLSEISELHSGNGHIVDGSIADVVAFERDDGGFDLAFEYLSGCDSERCLAEISWYFSTDNFCEPLELGAYYRYWTGDCWNAGGIPLWGVPERIPADQACR